MEDMIVGMPVKDVQIDELWSFVGCKERTRNLHSKPVGSCGDQYCFTALERNMKLLLAWHMGDRTHGEGVEFVLKLTRACSKERCQVSSDGWSPYKHLIPNNMKAADYGMVIKTFAGANDTGRYSPGHIIQVKLKRVAGNPDETRICTSHCERMNLSIRMKMRRFARLTNAFSRTFLHHEAALAMFFMHYNSCQSHSTLKGKTPAQAAGLATEKWTAADLVERTASYQKPEPPKGDWQKFLDTIGGE